MANESNLKPFKKGHDERRGSKPKGTRHISTWIQEMSQDESFQVYLQHPTKGYVEFKGAPLKAIIQTALHKAAAGDKDAREWLAKHGWKQQIEFEAEITHKFEEMDDDQLEAAIKARQDRIS